jgi:hypothetical protein
VLSMNEKSFIDFSKKSRMIDVLIRSWRNAFINMSSSFQDVDVDSFINWLEKNRYIDWRVTRHSVFRERKSE